MYESFFGFDRRPFSAIPQAGVYFPSEIIENARVTIARCIERSEGPAMLIAPVGTGKTLLCHVLAIQFGERLKVCQMANTRLCSRRALLQSILFELGLPYRGMEEGELRLSLIDHLATSDECANGLLLLVDEAHTVPTPLLEELRMITNLVRNGQSRVRLVLAGLPQLEERFAGPKLESFTQRIAARCYLEPMNREETAKYVRHLVSRAGGGADEFFDARALRLVYDATDGIPRLVNQLCDHALVMAAIGGHRRLDGGGIQEAWTDLQQLPEPVLHETHESDNSTGTFIEFGSLEDEGSVSPTATDDGVQTPRPDSIRDPAEQVDEIAGQLEEVEPLEVAETSDEVVQDGHEFVEDEPSVYHHSALSDGEASEAAAENPFAEDFQEEEVVLDRFLPLESAAGHHGRVTCDEGRGITQLMRPPETRMSLFTGCSSHDERSHGVGDEPESLEERVAAQLVRTEGLSVDVAHDSPPDCSTHDALLDVVPYRSTERPGATIPLGELDPDFPRTLGSLGQTLEDGSDEAVASAEELGSIPQGSSLFADAIQPFASVPPAADADVYGTIVELDDEDECSSGGSVTDAIDVVLPEQRDLVVVEEDDRGSKSHDAPAAAAGRAHRQEYRQLFAKLRRG